MPEKHLVVEEAVVEQPIANPAAKTKEAMTIEQAQTIRNALVKELFRIAPQTHPAKPRVQNIPKSSTRIVNKEESLDSLKSSDPNEPLPKDSISSIYTVNGVHLDVYDYFSLPATSSDGVILTKLQYINSIVNSYKTFEEGMRKIHSIDRKLGSSDMGETKLNKIYNWLRFSGTKGGK